MKRIALLGMPNTGKSTFFNRLTGASAKIGNWPGITVELLSAKILEGKEMVEIIDLPGIYNLHGFSEDEKVARHFIENTDVDLLVVIGNASQMDRQSCTRATNGESIPRAASRSASAVGVRPAMGWSNLSFR